MLGVFPSFLLLRTTYAKCIQGDSLHVLFVFMLGMSKTFEEVNGIVVDGTTNAYCGNDGWKGVPTKSVEMRYEGIVIGMFPLSGVIQESIVAVCEFNELYCT